MLSGKTVVITGSTAGIGYAAAEAFAAEGCNVVINGIEGAEIVRAKAERLTELHGAAALASTADVGDPAAVEAMMTEVEERFGGVDILVNNAVTRVFGPIEHCETADWDRAMAVNLSSAFHTIRCALPGMRARDWGRIINVASVFSLFATADRASYITTKTALLGLTRAVALETVKTGITCNAVCPGSVNTTHSGKVIAGMMESDKLSEEAAIERFLAGRQPGGRFVEPASVAAFMVFLCGPAGKDISGATLPIDLAWSAS